MDQSFFSSPIWWFLLAWALAWKGFAMWRAARNNQIAWFIAVLVVNLFGLLEILYLLFFQKDKN
ncbi:MAG: DUF5652 family protein [Candidatus Saganbacteria bacterium]|nr:DUF5652 family protein [Candidatus Saganbacteria bacterium]